MTSTPRFVDTSVLAYLYDDTDARKRALVQDLVAEHAGTIVISTQVLVEIFNVCTGKLGMSPAAAEAAVTTLSRLAVTSADRELVQKAAALAAESELSIFDSAIVCAAKRSGCETLLSEDSDFGASVDGVTIVNPFASI